MTQVVKILKRGWTVLRNDGPVEFVNNSREYLRRINVSKNGITISYQTGTRVDFEERWELLREQINEDDSTLLDIGCAEGDLTARFADMGLMSIGIERQSHAVTSARNNNSNRANLGFLKYEITPETIDLIPTVDVILLLTVYHHWVNEYGWEPAEDMLRSLKDHCDTLLFEMPDRKVDRPSVPGYTGESLVDYYTEFFKMVYNGDAAVKYLGTTDYKGGGRKDLLFAINFR